jgi:hypothetical protein
MTAKAISKLTPKLTPSCKDNSFSIQLPSVDGLDYAPGIFAAEDEEDMRRFIG